MNPRDRKGFSQAQGQSVSGTIRRPARAFFIVMLALLASGMFSASPARAAITYSGDLNPANPAALTTITDAFVGFISDGTLNVAGGSTLPSQHAVLGFSSGVTGAATVTGAGSSWAMGNKLFAGFYGTGVLSITNGGALSGTTSYLGYSSGSTGTATLDGAGSTWTIASTSQIVNSGTGTSSVINSGALYVGYGGTGTLNIFNGSSVVVTDVTTIGSLGTINFGGSGGTLTTASLVGSTSQITGVGTLVTRAWRGDFDLLVDGIAATTQTVARLTGPDQNVTVKLDTANTGTAPLSELSIGYQGTGSLAIRNGRTFASTTNYVGNMSGSSGTVMVDGSGSVWNAGTLLYVGYGGTGSASVGSGATISSATTYLGYNAGSSGSLIIKGTGSSLANSGSFTIGNNGAGSLNIVNGGTVNDAIGYVGYGVGSTGNVTVDGPGSKWTGTGALYVGNSGTGRLTITAGGNVSNTAAYIGYVAGSSGRAIVNGPGSTWANSGALYVGAYGAGRLSISAGGNVTASSVIVNTAASVLTVDVGSSLKVGSTGTGAISNKGTVRLVAGAGAANGASTPISYGAMSGAGTTQALGAVWNPATHTATVTGAATGAAGTSIGINPATIQRMLFTDSATGKSVGAGFQASYGPLTLTATALGAGDLSTLQAAIGTDKSILSGWDFSTTGYTSGSPVYLSLFAGSGLSLSDLSIWESSGSTWAMLDASDLAYAGTYASFTATDLNLRKYALVDPPSSVPIPGAMWLLGPGIAGIGLIRRRVSRKG